MKAQSFFEMSGTFDPAIHRHIAGYLNLLFPLSERHIVISVLLRWTHDRTVAACDVCTLKTLHFQNYFHVQALNNNSLSDRVFKAAKYRWIILVYKSQQDAHATEFI
jgi:hypothetical protein